MKKKNALISIFRLDFFRSSRVRSNSLGYFSDQQLLIKTSSVLSGIV